MKKLRYILPLFALMFIACDSNDDGFYNTVYVDTANLVNIETQAEYQVDDVLFVEAYIPNLLDEPGHLTPLDLRKTTGNVETFEFTYNIERNVNGEWLPVDLTNSFTIIDGLANFGSFVQAFPRYDVTEDAFIFRGGIELQQAGDYRISFGYNSRVTDQVELFSNSSNNNIIVKISSETNQLNDDGYYNFTVN
ncbi:MAG TPA: hypothetical protein VGB44_00125 [Flavobacterium sp.]|jgi:hypothetical protein